MKISNPPTSPFRKGGLLNFPSFLKGGFGVSSAERLGEITKNNKLVRGIFRNERD
jgi:hypothetical protein